MSNNRFPPGDWAFLSGVNVKVTPDPFRYGPLPDDVCVPAAFRAEFNAWCQQFFSRAPENNLLKDGQFYQMDAGAFGGHGKTLVMNPRTFAQL